VKKAILLRFLWSMLLGMLIAGLVTEVAFRSLGNTTSRPPERIELVIPPGTAQKVANGQEVLAQNMVFVTGDTLVVTNHDSVPHTLGPLFIPVGASSILTLNNAENLTYSCSFVPSRKFGLDVREALTFSTRLYGLLLAGIPMGLLLSVYSFIAWPLKKDQPGQKTGSTPTDPIASN